MPQKDKSPLFSVIIPTLGKVDQWLGAIESVLRQTYADFELIAVDSGPESASKAKVADLNDPRIIYINTSTGNPRLNWDTGYRHSTGEYIVWMDDDNYLLPHALETLSKTIAKENHPDVVTAEHMHYRSKDHYIPEYRNQLVINLPLFGGKVTKEDSRDVVRRLMGWPQKTAFRARIHMTETAVKREVVEKLLSKIGEINFETTSTHSLRLGVMALTSSMFVLDTPIALVGQSGNALTDTWPKIDSPVLKEVKYSLKLSPFPVLTYANYRLENMLRTKAALGDTLSDVGPNMPKFTDTYRRELIAFNQSWSMWYRNWKQITKFIRTQNDPGFIPLKRNHLKFHFLSLGVHIVRKIHLYGILKELFKHERLSHNNARTIQLDSYGVTSIGSCADTLPEIIQKELAIPYATFISSTQ